MLLAAAALGVTASASAAQLVTNGDFEAGTLAGWTALRQPGGPSSWLAYSRKEFEEGKAVLSPPPSGEWAAESTLLPAGTDYLYQDVTLPAETSDQLSFYLYYSSAEPLAVPSPNTLFASESDSAQPNQQVRVDVLKANAPIESLSPNDVLATAYASKAGDPTEMAPTLFHADLSAFAGQTVRLRVAAVAQQGPLAGGVDGVSIDSEPLPPPPPPSPIWSPPSNAFSTGRLFLDRKHGAAKLDVTLPGPGGLTVTDARRQVAIASARVDSGQLPTRVRTVSVRAGGPQTVSVWLRPTPWAKKRLKKRGSLFFRLFLTYTPDGGMTATQGYEGTLRKVVRRSRR